jgi:DNA-directed RNA polymerase sigma subunit (sigma70/sigma32)|tara:strand:- start:214 stop:438 length:225 start_codon:yes stop_codon:yes gene_type:complete
MDKPNKAPLLERELEIIKLRFGIGQPHGEGMTLLALSKQYGVSKERIRQIEVNGLKKLSHHPEMQRIRHLVQEI